MESSTRNKAIRESKAIHLWYTTEMTQKEIAEEIGVGRDTISRYVNSEPSQEVQELLEEEAAQVRIVALNELRQQLREAGEKARSAEKPIKVWTDESGHLNVNDKVNPETGEITGKYPVPSDMEMGPDEEARYYARGEIREILDQMAELVGAKSPQEIEMSGGGIIIQTEADDE